MTRLVNLLSRVRGRTVAMAATGWEELGALVDSGLTDPLDPIALLPVATGMAAGGGADKLVDTAAAVLLIALALRAVDDCADMDNPRALYRRIGVGRTLNYAMALNTIAARELSRSPALLPCLRAVLEVCHGQDRDIRKSATTLAGYEEVVRLKTVAAYELAAVAGARTVSSDARVHNASIKCGRHLGWMTQIVNDIVGLWFPISEDEAPVETRTFPVLLGVTLDHPNAKALSRECRADAPDRARICALLDEMDVRRRLMSVALDHRDQAIASLGGKLNPEGRAILKLWLDWLLRDGERMLKTEPSAAAAILSDGPS